MLTVVAAPVGILTMRQYMDAEATTETVDYDTLKRLIDPNRGHDPVKLNANDKLSIDTDPKNGITYALESLSLNASTGAMTTVSEGVARLYPPATDAHDDKVVLGENDMVIFRGTTYDIALDVSEKGFSSYIVALNENAPTSYDFDFDLPNGYKFSEDGSGGIEILDEENNLVGNIGAPWAVDSNLNSVPTEYKLRGEALVQTIQHSGASYPVVADPSFSYGAGIYVRWSLDGNDDPEDVIDDVEDWNDKIANWNCWLFDGSLAVVSLGRAKTLAQITNAQAAAVLAANVFGDGFFCTGVYNDRDDVNDALDDIEDAMPDAIDPWNGEIAEDCTLMVRHYYGGFMVNKLQLEDCHDATGVYYD